jgi:hypothetical protein
VPVHAHFNGRRSLGIASVLEIPPQRAHHLIRANRRFFYVKPPLPTGRLEIYTNRGRVEGRLGAFKALKNMSPISPWGLLIGSETECRADVMTDELEALAKS